MPDFFFGDETLGPLFGPAYAWARVHFGAAGATAVTICFCVVFIWRNWDSLKKLPFAQSILARLGNFQRLPRPNTPKFAIAVTHLLADEKAANEQLVIEDLRDFHGIEVIRVNRTINDRDIMKAHAEARKLLTSIGANVLLWGRVLSQDGRTRVKLYWSSQDDTVLSSQGKRYPYNDDLSLPPLFWEDLQVALNVLVASTKKELDLLEGSYTASEVAPFAEKLRTLLSAAEGKWAPASLVPLQLILATSLFTMTEETGDVSMLMETARLTEAALVHVERGTQDWNKLRMTYASALLRLGTQSSDDTMLKKALQLSRELVTEDLLAASPSMWAIAQRNLGATLHTIGAAQRRANLLREAVRAYELAASTQESLGDRLAWAMTQHNLGATLHTLGRQENNREDVERSLQVLDLALQERTRERVPVYWALTKYNIANALRTLADLKSAPELIESAVREFREALEELPRWRLPYDWVMAQRGLGRVLGRLGELRRDVGLLREAEGIFQRILHERSDETSPTEWAEDVENLASAQALIGYYTQSPTELKNAIASYEGALAKRSRVAAPFLWASSKEHIANAAQLLADLEGSPSFLDLAATSLLEALEERSPDRSWTEWARSTAQLANILRTLGEQRNDLQTLEDAAKLYRRLLTYRNDMEWNWPLLWTDLANTLLAMNRLDSNEARVTEAADAAMQMLKASGGLQLFGDGFTINLRRPDGYVSDESKG